MKGLELKFLIKDRGSSQTEIAEKLKISRVHLGRILSDGIEVDPFYENKILQAVGLPGAKGYVSNETNHQMVSEPNPMEGLTQDQTNALLMNVNSYVFALVELQCESIALATNVPLEQVRERVRRLIHDRRKTVERILKRLEDF